MDIFLIYNSPMKPKKQGRGRPPKGSGPVKTQTVLIRLDPAEKRTFGDAAELAGISVAAWMRERLRRAAIRELEEVGRPVALFDHLKREQ
jgi:hypothetical protein